MAISRDANRTWRAETSRAGTVKLKTMGTMLDADIDIVTAAGTFSASTGTLKIDKKPIVQINTSGSFFTDTSKSTYGIVTTKPSSGVDGSNYLTLDATGTQTVRGQASSKGKATITKSGWIDKDTVQNQGTASTAGIDATIDDKFTAHYMPIVGVSFSGGAPSVTGASNTISLSSNMTASADATAFVINAKAAATASVAKVTYTNSAGAIAAHNGTQALAANSKTNSNIAATAVYLKAATCTVAGGGLSKTDFKKTDLGLTLALATGTNVSTSLVGYTNTKPTSGYYVAVKGNTAKVTGTTNVARAAITEAHTEGYLLAKTATTEIAATSLNANVEVNAASRTGYITLTGGNLNNAATSDVIYEENTADSTIIPANGALYINEGWYPNTKITLGHLIPDDVNYTNAGSGQILNGYEAYDTNGNKLIGTIPTITPTFTGGAISGSVTDLVPGTGVTLGTSDTYSAGLKITGKASAGRASVTYNGNWTGYLNKATGTVAYAGTSSNTSLASRDEYINGITIPSGCTYGDGSTYPIVVNGTAWINTTGASNIRFATAGAGAVNIAGTEVAKNGAVITTSVTNTLNTSTSPQQRTISWGTGWITSGSIVLKASDIAYGTYTATGAVTETDIAKYAKLTIAAGAFSTKGGSVTASSATLSDTNTSGISVTGKATATVTKSGWINTGDAAASSQTRYLTEAVIGAGKKLKVTLSTGTTSAPTELIIVDGINTWHFKRDKDNNTWIE